MAKEAERLSTESATTVVSQDTKQRTATSQEEVPTKLVKEVEEAVQHHLEEEKVQEKVGKVQAKEKVPRSVSTATATTVANGATAALSAGVHPQTPKDKAKVRKKRKAKAAEKDTKDGGARTAPTVRHRWLSAPCRTRTARIRTTRRRWPTSKR